jgi:hypothetical protein
LAPVIITGDLSAGPASSPGANVLMLAHVCSDASPCFDTKEDKGTDDGGEQGDLTHVNTICISLHHATHLRMQLNLSCNFVVLPASQRATAVTNVTAPGMSWEGDQRKSYSARTKRDGLGRVLQLESIAARRRLRVGISRKGDQRRKTGAAFPAVPNVTRLLVAPILGSYGRNQLRIALNAMHHVNLTTSTRR